jgi:two-component system, OmpR family, sensor kinase
MSAVAAARARLTRAGAAVRSVAANTPLRVRLLLALLGLVALGLTVTGTAGARALRTYLLDRVDNQLATTANAAAQRAMHGVIPLGRPGGRPLDDSEGYRPALASAFYVQLTDSSGQGGAELRLPDGSDQTPPRLPTLTADEVARRAGAPFTTPAQGRGYDWRVLVMPLPDNSGVITVATSLDDVDSTVGRLQRIDLVVGLGVLAALAVLGHLAVRGSLRRLVEVEQTAEAIAAGDLTRRVPEAGDRTEVGRLAGALNSMLAQIERAFSAQRASEASARASEERMRRFVADAGHELRTPLTSIRGFAELHRQGAMPDADAVDQAMRRIEGEATRMGLLVDDLLLLARLDQQRPLERQPVELLTIVGDAVIDAQAAAPDHPVDVEQIGEDGAAAAVVLGDEARLRQVVANLMSNAATHTPPGTAVTVRVGSSGGSAVLEVADNGPGLAPEQAARVFERFYRADPARTRAQGGAGLGLSIVAALVAAHGGSVDVVTRPGQGACFSVRLPLYTPLPPAPAENAS